MALVTTPSKYFISGDWGTSNFRLRVVETESLKVLVEQQTKQGVKATYREFADQTKLDQFHFFARYFSQQIAALPSQYHELPVVLSGMASANIGMLELPYADLPFGKKGKQLVKKECTLPNGKKILLISGAKSPAGMMRGEEIQALGLVEELDRADHGILLLPGTHSKHINYEKGQFTDLRTYMTGELFDLLSKKSLLENNTTYGPWNEETKKAFSEGVTVGARGDMTVSLFTIRARHLLQNVSKIANYYLLSGLLIGDELAYLQNKNSTVFLAAPAATEKLYKTALQHILSDHHPVVVFSRETIDRALLSGQRKMLNLYEI